jgi:manganese/zinc/iron transport system permease protein
VSYFNCRPVERIIRSVTIFDFLTDSTAQTVALGTVLLGAMAGMVGSFAVVRRESLQGDAVSHAALPGLALAFLFGGRGPGAVLLGGAVAGWCALGLVGLLARRRVPYDAALGGVLAVAFGLGLALQTFLIRRGGDAAQFGFERFLFGQAALLRTHDIALIAGVGLAILIIILLFWKELKLAAFDPEFALAAGLPVKRLNLLLSALIVAAVVAGLQAVGVVLVSALLVAPAVAARQWTDRFPRAVLLAVGFGAASGLLGTLTAYRLEHGELRVPTGPLIVLAATLLAGLSLVFAPKRGLAWRGRRA